MQENASSVLTAWASFFVITGSSGASLTGLMFVVITIIADRGTQARDEGIAAFSTPTVVHFCGALLVSAILSAPWRSLVPAGFLLALAGALALVYVCRVLVRARRLSTYRPDIEDWTWYTILPCVTYAAITAGGVLLTAVPGAGMFALAGASLLLIFIGIHNAWDTVTYIAIDNVEDASEPVEPS